MKPWPAVMGVASVRTVGPDRGTGRTGYNTPPHLTKECLGACPTPVRPNDAPPLPFGCWVRLGSQISGPLLGCSAAPWLTRTSRYRRRCWSAPEDQAFRPATVPRSSARFRRSVGHAVAVSAWSAVAGVRHNPLRLFLLPVRRVSVVISSRRGPVRLPCRRAVRRSPPRHARPLISEVVPGLGKAQGVSSVLRRRERADRHLRLNRPALRPALRALSLDPGVCVTPATHAETPAAASGDRRANAGRGRSSTRASIRRPPSRTIWSINDAGAGLSVARSSSSDSWGTTLSTGHTFPTGVGAPIWFED